MCAIAGEIGNTVFSDYHKKMQETMRRRGPDSEGVYIGGGAVMLHCRLAVIDPQNGKQPMSAGNYTICYNGELYNTEEIRSELLALGVTFQTDCDTEVVLKAYIHFGEKALEKFNGIFAFAVFNKAKNELFLARDPMGVKPLFYSLTDGKIIFSSEIKTLLCHPKIRPVIDRRGLCELLFTAPGRTSGTTPFRDILEIEPGECAVFDGELKKRKYFDFHDRPHTDSLEETVEKVRFLVTDSIRRQLVSDVPIGTFLSGGLDSSIISAVAADEMRKKGEQLKTFSVTYKDNEKFFTKTKFQPNTDEPFISLMADFLGSEHHLITLDNYALADALFDAVDARDVPGMADVDSSLLLFCKEIKKEVTVALSGECADEIFGGYPWFRDKEIRSKYGFPWAQSTAYRESFLCRGLFEELNGEKYINSLYDKTLKEVSKQEGLSETEDRMREMVYLNYRWFMQTLLDRKDRMSMYSSLEVRVPFCDRRIAEYLYSTPWEYKDYNGREKGLLRTAMEGLLPEEILWRKKSPYPKTRNPEFLNIVSKMLNSLSPSSPIFDLLDHKKALALPETQNEVPWYGQLMTVPQTVAFFLQLNYFLEKYHCTVEI